jgi:hypothetical protein
MISGPVVVYSLCLATSMLCAALLTRAYMRARSTLLFWTALSFALLAFNNMFLVGDMLIFHDLDLRPWRQITVLAAIGVLIYGFLQELR